MYKLKQIIDDYVADKPTTIKTVVLEEFSKAIDFIINLSKKEDDV